MVNAIVPLDSEDVPNNNFGWFQMEKKTAGEFQKLVMKSPAAMATLMFLVSKMSRSNAIVVSQQAIATEIGVQRKAVNMAVSLLVSQKFIEVVKVGTALVYRVNHRVAWQGRRGERYAHFGADILAYENEQDSPIDENPEPLKQVPVLIEGERVVVGNEEIDPPDQQEMMLF